MTARTQRELRQGLVLAKGDYAGFAGGYSDEEITEFVKSIYGWETVVIQRDGAIARARPGTPPSPTELQKG